MPRFPGCTPSREVTRRPYRPRPVSAGTPRPADTPRPLPERHRPSARPPRGHTTARGERGARRGPHCLTCLLGAARPLQRGPRGAEACGRRAGGQQAAPQQAQSPPSRTLRHRPAVPRRLPASRTRAQRPAYGGRRGSTRHLRASLGRSRVCLGGGKRGRKGGPGEPVESLKA